MIETGLASLSEVSANKSIIDKTPWQLEYPYDIATSVEGDLYLVEYGGGRVTCLNRDGKLLGRWGRTGSAQGQLATPWGLAVDSQLRVFIADTGNRRMHA